MREELCVKRQVRSYYITEFLALEKGNPLTCAVYPIPSAPTQELILQLILLSYIIINFPF